MKKTLGQLKRHMSKKINIITPEILPEIEREYKLWLKSGWIKKGKSKNAKEWQDFIQYLNNKYDNKTTDKK